MTASAARNRPKALDPAVIKLVEALARAQARREDRRNQQAVGQEPRETAEQTE